METWYLIDTEGRYLQIFDKCLANSREVAEAIFINRGWVIGNVLSEADYIAEQELNKLENQSSEQ